MVIALRVLCFPSSIDFFVNRQLKQKCFGKLPRGDLPVLMRRALYDLHGLPPTPEQLGTSPAGCSVLIDPIPTADYYSLYANGLMLVD